MNSRHKRSSVMRLVKAQGDRCFYCQRTLIPATQLTKAQRRRSPLKRTIDHVIPLAQGGRSNLGNLALACQQCNNSKGDRMPFDWAMPIDLGQPIHSQSEVAHA